jgi:hypothetical protein
VKCIILFNIKINISNNNIIYYILCVVMWVRSGLTVGYSVRRCACPIAVGSLRNIQQICQKISLPAGSQVRGLYGLKSHESSTMRLLCAPVRSSILTPVG